LPASLLQYLDISSSSYGREMPVAAPMPPGLLLGLAALPRLQRLDVSRRPLSEAQLRQLLLGCKQLQELRILGAPLTWQQVGRGWRRGWAGVWTGDGRAGDGRGLTWQQVDRGLGRALAG
jgi:hypothetical protein